MPHGSVADEAVRANGHLIRQVERIVRDASQARGDPEPIPTTGLDMHVQLRASSITRNCELTN